MLLNLHYFRLDLLGLLVPLLQLVLLVLLVQLVLLLQLLQLVLFIQSIVKKIRKVLKIKEKKHILYIQKLLKMTQRSYENGLFRVKIAIKLNLIYRTQNEHENTKKYGIISINYILILLRFNCSGTKAF